MTTQKNKKTKKPITFTRVLFIIVLLVGIYYFLPQLSAFKHTFTILRHASLIWLLVALIATCLSFVASAVTQFTAGNYLGKISEIAYLDFAGAFYNHFLSSSLTQASA